MANDMERFEELRFLYACDKLEPEEAAWIASLLAKQPALVAEIEADRALVKAGREALEFEMETARPLVPFHVIARALDAEAAPLWRQRLLAAALSWWQRPLPAGYAACAMAVLALAVGTQSFYAGRAIDEDAVYRGTPGAPLTSGRVVVMFSDDLTVGLLRKLSGEMQFDVVHGPDEQGVLLLAPRAGVAADELVRRLKAHPDVVDAYVAKQ